MSINDVKISNDEKFTFVKTKMLLIPKLIFAVIFAILTVIPVKITVMNIILKVVIAVVFVVFLVSLLSVRKNGLYISKDGKIKLVSGMSKDEFELASVKRIAVNFTEWENEEFSAQLKFVFEDGEIFTKDYAKKFESTSNHFFLSAYTMSKQETDEYCKKLAEMNICNISVIDMNKDIIYQHIKK